MKKFLSLLLTFAMVFSLAVPAFAAEPDYDGEVSGTYTPVISISGFTLSGDAVTVDETNKIYTITIPVDATKASATFTVSGTNLGYITDDTRSNYRIGYGGSATDLLPSRYDTETGNMIWEKTNFATSDGGALKYTNDGTNWTETGWTLKVVQAYSITNATASDANGTIEVPASAVAGDTVTVTVNANEGYELGTLTVVDADNNPVTVENNQFEMPSSAVTVTATFVAAPTKYTVTDNTAADANGSVAIDKASAAENDTVTLTVTPAEGYELDALTISDGTNTLEYTAGEAENTYTFTMPAANVTVTATFKQIVAEITGLKLHVDGKEYKSGETAILTSATESVIITVIGDNLAYAAQNNIVTYLNGCDSLGEDWTVNEDGTVTIDITENVSWYEGYLYGAYELNYTNDRWETLVNTGISLLYHYTVNLPEATEGGSVTADKATVARDGSVTLTVTPNAGYELETLTVTDANGNEVTTTAGENGTYTFTIPNTDVTVTATFKESTKYAVNIDTAITNGTVTATPTSAAEGETVTLTVEADAKYELGTIKVTRDDTGAEVTVTDKTFTMPASNVTVTATFNALPITSANITWGNLSYTYSDDTSAWSVAEAEAGKQANDTVIVTNTGDSAITATVAYAAAENYTDLGVSGTVTAASDATTNSASIAAAGKETFTLALSGKPAKALSGETIGTVTVTIGGGTGVS